MRILLDNGIFIHSEFAEGAVQSTQFQWDDAKQRVKVQGFIRKARHKDSEFQRHNDALFTIGRLIRERRIQAYVYNELQFERARGGRGWQACYALKGCTINHCPTALERSRNFG